MGMVQCFADQEFPVPADMGGGAFHLQIMSLLYGRAKEGGGGGA